MTYNPPTVSGEETISTGRSYAVETYTGPEPGLQVKTWTGNGDDGVGVTMWWANDTVDTTFKYNVLLQVAGEKAAAGAEILGLDGLGSPINDQGGSLISSEGYVIIPDLFDSELGRIPDQVFTVSTGAPAADVIFQVLKLAAQPDQVFNVTAEAPAPDQTFEVKAIQKQQVDVAELPFVVEVFAEPADQTFEVIAGAPPADVTFIVNRGPSAADQVFDVLIINELSVITSWAPPDKIFGVIVGPTPAPTPDQIFGVSIGGPDAPPIPDPNQTFNVTTGVGVPDTIFTTLVVDRSFGVEVAQAPFQVVVGPTPPDQIFQVEALAEPASVFDVTVGPSTPDQIFTLYAIDTFDVLVNEAPLSYAVQNTGSSAYQFTGSGLFAQNNPDIVMSVGQLAAFNISTPGHPFWICDLQTTGGSAFCSTDPVWADQMDNNGTEELQVRVIFNTAGTYFYNCSIHAAMSGRIVVSSTIYNYDVTNSGSGDYLLTGEFLNGSADPTLTGLVGERFEFDVDALGHPFWVKDTSTGGAGNASEPWADYLEGNGSQQGLVTVVFNTAGTYYYQCEYHAGMLGQIIIS